jgi:hypothetical protein
MHNLSLHCPNISTFYRKEALINNVFLSIFVRGTNTSHSSVQCFINFSFSSSSSLRGVDSQPCSDLTHSFHSRVFLAGQVERQMPGDEEYPAIQVVGCAGGLVISSLKTFGYLYPS